MDAMQEEVNKDPAIIAWENVVRALEASLSQEGIEFLPVLIAVAEFIRVCHTQQLSYTTPQKLALLDRMSRHMVLRIPQWMRRNDEEDFYTKLESFIVGTQTHFFALERDDDVDHFKLLGEWLTDVVQLALLSYEPKNRGIIQNREIAKLYCTFYKDQQNVRLQTIKRVGTAVAIFTDCLSLENSELGGLITFDELSCSKIRIEQFEERHNILMQRLQRAAKLTPELRRALMAERALLIDFLNKYPYEKLEFRVLPEIYKIIEAMLEQDRAYVLREYQSPGKVISNLTEPLIEILKREYFPNDPNGIPDGEDAINALVKEYDTFILEYKELLGEKPNRLTDEALDKLFFHYEPLERLVILEDMFADIIKNEGKIYTPDTFASRENPKFTRAQLDHIKLLQRRYLRIIEENPELIDREQITSSKLLGFKINPRKEVNVAKATTDALETLARAQRPRSPLFDRKGK